MNNERKRRPRFWRQRGRRYAAEMNAAFAVLLAGAAVILINYLVASYLDRHWDVSFRRYYALSDKTVSLLGSSSGEINVVVFFQKSHDLYADVKNLLTAYEAAALEVKTLDLHVEFVDPDRELARTRELAAKYDVKRSERGGI